jgi:hypothetical protein
MDFGVFDFVGFYALTLASDLSATNPNHSYESSVRCFVAALLAFVSLFACAGLWSR